MTPGSLPPRPAGPPAHGHGRWAEGAGFSFAIAEARPPGRGFASAALIALTSFGWIIPALHRIELYIER